MKWLGRRQSSNVEDRRGMGTKALAGGGVIGIVIYLLTIFGGETGQQLAPILEQITQNSQISNSSQRELTTEEIELGNFASTVFADTEDIWKNLFEKNGMIYEEPGMVLFTGQVSSDCGSATSSSGPFYCPSDQKVYMDLDFFQELKNRFGSDGGEFAIAYVIAHEVGHHVQNQLGVATKVRQLQQNMSTVEANRLSIQVELQADFYAGIWAHYMQKYLEAGDIESALSAANAVGDDAIQKKGQGQVDQDTFTHGTSEQRKRWFTKGFDSGDISLGDTFSMKSL